MGLQYSSLDDARDSALAELGSDAAADKVYASKRLTDAGLAAWPGLLESALRENSDDWLATQIPPLLKPADVAMGKPKKMNKEAHETLAEGEFNHYYMRGVCVAALARGSTAVEVYRAKTVAEPRPESEALIGTTMDAAELLENLRSNRFKIRFAGPNSGLSIRLP